MERSPDLNPTEWKRSLAKGILPQALPENAELNRQLYRFAQKINRGAVVVDLGCGVGNEARCLNACGLKIFCLDGAKKMLDYCDPKSPRIQADLFSLPFASNSVDAIIINHVLFLGRYEEAEQIMGEVLRTLKPNGAIFTSVEQGFPSQNVTKVLLERFMKSAQLEEIQVWLGSGKNSKWWNKFQIYGTGYKQAPNLTGRGAEN